MITGLCDKWETWQEIERRNREEMEDAFALAARVAHESCNLMVAQDWLMRDYALCVEAVLNETCRALRGDRQDLEFCIRTGAVHWREQRHGKLTARAFGQEKVIGYQRRDLIHQTQEEWMEVVRFQARPIPQSQPVAA